MSAAAGLFSWKRISVLLVTLLVVTIAFTQLPDSLFRSATPVEIFTPSSSMPKTLSNGTRSFDFGNATAYNDNIDGLTDEECAEAFPDIYDDLHSTMWHWRFEKHHSVVSEDLDTGDHEAMVRVLIHENQMRILASSYAVERPNASPDRALGLLNLIKRALDSSTAGGDILPTIETTLKLRDFPEIPENETDTHAAWTFAKTKGLDAHKRLWLMPNFDFWYYAPTGAFEDAKRYAMQHDAPFKSKIPKIVWRGNAGFNDIRADLINVTHNKSWADVKQVSGDEDPPVYLKPDELCRYAMTVYTEGVTYSGRLKFLTNCASLLFSPDAKYVTHYSHLLIPAGFAQNYVLVQRDWSDLEEKVQHYLNHPDDAERIIRNMLKLFRSKYTTRASVSCYIRRLIRAYALTTTEWKYQEKTADGWRLRGVSFEEFMDNPKDKDYRKR